MTHGTPIKNSYWVVPDKFLAGGYPLDWTNATKLMKLMKEGSVSFIDLTEPGEWTPYRNMLNRGASCRYRNFPIPDFSTPCSTEYTKKILDAIDEDIENGRLVYIHCLAGRGRTGTIVGCWLSRHGKRGKDALDELTRRRGESLKSATGSSPVTDEQRRYVKEWNEPA